MIFSPAPECLEHVRAARLRPLAVTSTTHLEALPEIPTVAELVPGYESSGWQGVGAPRNTPIEVIELLNREINAGLSDPKVKSRLADLTASGLPLSAAHFRHLVTMEVEKWGKVVKFAGIKAE